MPDKNVDVPGVGIVSFPDSMKDEEISAAIQKSLIQSKFLQGEDPTETNTYKIGNAVEGGLRGFSKSFGYDPLSPPKAEDQPVGKGIVQGIKQTLSDPGTYLGPGYNAVKGLIDQGKDIYQNIKSGDYAQAGGEGAGLLAQALLARGGGEAASGESAVKPLSYPTRAAGNILKGAYEGARDSPIKHPFRSMGIGEVLGRYLGLPHEAGAVLGLAEPKIVGGIKGGARGLIDTPYKSPYNIKLIGNPAWKELPESTPEAPGSTIGPVNKPELPSGRTPGGIKNQTKTISHSESIDPEIAKTLKEGDERTHINGETQILKKVPIDAIDPEAPESTGNNISEEKMQDLKTNPNPVHPELKVGDNGYTIHEGHHRILNDVRNGKTDIIAWTPKSNPESEPTTKSDFMGKLKVNDLRKSKANHIAQHAIDNEIDYHNMPIPAKKALYKELGYDDRISLDTDEAVKKNIEGLRKLNSQQP